MSEEFTRYEALNVSIEMLREQIDSNDINNIPATMQYANLYALASIADSLHKLSSVFTSSQNISGAITVETYNYQG